MSSQVIWIVDNPAQRLIQAFEDQKDAIDFGNTLNEIGAPVRVVACAYLKTQDAREDC